MLTHSVRAYLRARVITESAIEPLVVLFRDLSGINAVVGNCRRFYFRDPYLRRVYRTPWGVRRHTLDELRQHSTRSAHTLRIRPPLDAHPYLRDEEIVSMRAKWPSQIAGGGGYMRYWPFNYLLEWWACRAVDQSSGDGEAVGRLYQQHRDLFGRTSLALAELANSPALLSDGAGNSPLRCGQRTLAGRNPAEQQQRVLTYEGIPLVITGSWKRRDLLRKMRRDNFTYRGLGVIVSLVGRDAVEEGISATPLRL